jgi:sulfate permease, SulP family
MVDEAKSRTQVAQITTAVVVAIVLLFLTKPLQYLPNAVLSAVVFVIGIKLIDIANMRRIYGLRKDEFVVAALTALVVVGVGVEQGIILAIVLSIVLHVRRHYLPKNSVVTLDRSGDLVMHPPTTSADEIEPGIVVYRFAVGVFYANAEKLAEDVTELVDRPDPPRWFVLMADGIDDVDYTGGMALAELAEQLESRKIVLVIAEASDSLKHELARFGVTGRIGEDHYFDSVAQALDAFRHAAR